MGGGGNKSKTVEPEDKTAKSMSGQANADLEAAAKITPQDSYNLSASRVPAFITLGRELQQQMINPTTLKWDANSTLPTRTLERPANGPMTAADYNKTITNKQKKADSKKSGFSVGFPGKGSGFNNTN